MFCMKKLYKGAQETTLDGYLEMMGHRNEVDGTWVGARIPSLLFSFFSVELPQYSNKLSWGVGGKPDL